MMTRSRDMDTPKRIPGMDTTGGERGGDVAVNPKQTAVRSPHKRNTYPTLRQVQGLTV